MKAPHPLIVYLEAKDQKPWRFADAHKMPRTNLYAVLRGKIANPSLNMLQGIEDATGGAVTVQMQADWAKAQNRKRRAPR